MLRTAGNAPTDKRDYTTTQRELGFALRTALSCVLWEPLPEPIRLLLDQLRDKECREKTIGDPPSARKTR